MLVTCEGQQSFDGKWSREEAALSINFLETRAILLCCQALPPSLDGQDIMVRTDNVSAKAAVNKGGSAASSRINDTIISLLKHSKLKDRMVRAMFLPGSENIAADGLSRSSLAYPEECFLSRSIFKLVCA